MILLIEGSERADGNGAYLAELITAEIPEAKRIKLRDLSFRDCNACGDCRKEERLCTIEDDLKAFYPDFTEADGIILISPSYYGLPSAEVKKLIDRWYCMKLPKKRSRFKEGAKVLLFLTQGSSRKIRSFYTLFWLKIVMNNHKCGFRGTILTECSFDDHCGINNQKSKILKYLRYIQSSES